MATSAMRGRFAYFHPSVPREQPDCSDCRWPWLNRNRRWSSNKGRERSCGIHDAKGSAHVAEFQPGAYARGWGGERGKQQRSVGQQGEERRSGGVDVVTIFPDVPPVVDFRKMPWAAVPPAAPA